MRRGSFFCKMGTKQQPIQKEQSMQKHIMAWLAIAGLFTGLWLSGCQTPILSGGGNPPLRVGVATDNPPMIFKQGGQILGLEADHAREMAKALGRPLQFVEIPWDDLIGALLGDRIDIIMSGMTVTPERNIRIAFSDSFMQQGMMALIRRADRNRFSASDRICEANVNFTVQKKTTADIYAQQNCRNASSIAWMDPKDAAEALCAKMTDVYIHDAAVITWMASENEADLIALPLPSKKDHLAWGLKKSDTELLETVNKVLDQWKQDKTLDRLRKRWIQPD